MRLLVMLAVALTPTFGYSQSPGHYWRRERCFVGTGPTSESRIFGFALRNWTRCFNGDSFDSSPA
jgi:hypothetical protein